MIWGYASLNFLALLYFYYRWSAPDAQHRQFHYLMMCCAMINAGFYAYQNVVSLVAPGAFGMSIWWYKLIDNILFEALLVLIFIYGMLFRRAKADTAKWRSDVDGWFERAGNMRRGLRQFGRRRNSRLDESASARADKRKR